MTTRYTLQKRAELARLTVELSPVLIFWVREDGSFLYANRAVMKALGYTSEAFYQLGAVDILSEHDEDGRWALRERLHHHQRITVRTRLRRKDGSTFPVESIMNLVELDGQRIDCAFARDITDTLAYEEMLLAKQELLAFENEMLKTAAGLESDRPILGRSAALRTVLAKARRIAPCDEPVILTGESGTGKELLARYLHEHSRRRTTELVPINCASLHPEMVLSKLFGHVQGAFTGAGRARRGVFELASGSTLFLDEIAELPPTVQAQLLRVLQEGQIIPLGDDRPRPVDVRIIAATNRDLPAMVRAGLFRMDLFARLNVFTLHLPPLRERREDIPLLVNFFLHRLNEKTGRKIAPPTADELSRLSSHSFTGNIRELENIVKRAYYLSAGRRLSFPESIFSELHFGPAEAGLVTLEQIQIRHIKRVLEHCQGQIAGEAGAARILGLKESTLRSRIKRLGLDL